MLNPIVEAEWEELKRGCRELNILAPPEVHIGVELFDRNRKKKYSDIQRGNSWTRNFYNAVFGMMSMAPGGGSNNFGAGYMSIKRTTGTLDYSATYTINKGYQIPNYFFHWSGAASTAGIMVGTSSAAFDDEHYTMQTLISHGFAAGNLMYYGMTNPVLSYNAGTYTWTNTHNRLFENLSGGSITVAETGIYASITGFSASTYYYLCERNVLDSSIAVADNDMLKVSYAFSMDFTAIDA